MTLRWFETSVGQLRTAERSGTGLGRLGTVRDHSGTAGEDSVKIGNGRVPLWGVLDDSKMVGIIGVGSFLLGTRPYGLKRIWDSLRWRCDGCGQICDHCGRLGPLYRGGQRYFVHHKFFPKMYEPEKLTSANRSGMKFSGFTLLG